MSLLRTFGPAVALLSLGCAVGASAPIVDLPAAEEAAPPVVRQTGWVTDAADILPDEPEARLAAKLAGLERRTRHQVVVVTLPTLGGRDVADVADELGNAWGVGHGDGVVVLVAPNDRRMRISTAEGVTGLLLDETCQQIIDDKMLPRFRDGDFPGGVEAGVDAIIARLGPDRPSVEP